MLARIDARVPFYHERPAKAGVRPEDVRSTAGLAALPFTTEQDLRDNYPFGLFAAPMEEVVRIHASSGTTGKMTVVGYTRQDAALWAELMARTLSCAGATARDMVQIAYGYGAGSRAWT
ncbi:MAG: phenylacetate--CoA ligase family protein [Bacteroidota bacterium]